MAERQPTKVVKNELGIEPLMTHKEIAAVLGVSRCRVHQIEKRALEKLRAEADRLGLKVWEIF